MNEENLQQLANELAEKLTPEQITFGQAISVCSVIVEMGLQRASLEDITEGLDNRFGGMVNRKEIRDVANHAIRFGLSFGLFETVDTETIALSSEGLLIGRDWLNKIYQEAA
jgi:Ca2+-binding EF-hand superfamily protein